MIKQGARMAIARAIIVRTPARRLRHSQDITSGRQPMHCNQAPMLKSRLVGTEIMEGRD